MITGTIAAFLRPSVGYSATVTPGAVPIVGQTLTLTHQSLFPASLPIAGSSVSTDYQTGTPAPAAAPIIYTGNGTALPVSGVGFSPDLVIIKRRLGAFGWRWVDNIRGVGTSLDSTSTAVGASEATGLTSFDSDGFTVGADTDYNASTAGYLALCFQEQNGAFDMLTYVGNSATQTIPHNLGVVPEVMIMKAYDSAARSWGVYNVISGNAMQLILNGTAAAAASATAFNSTTPTSTDFYVGANTNTNATGQNYMAYLFASKTGVSKIGSYTGTGDTSGATVSCGFLPRFLMTRRLDVGSGWRVWDNQRDATSPHTIYSQLNSTAAESTGTGITFSGTSFQITDPASEVNAVGGTYLYMAFA